MEPPVCEGTSAMVAKSRYWLGKRKRLTQHPVATQSLDSCSYTPFWGWKRVYVQKGNQCWVSQLKHKKSADKNNTVSHFLLVSVNQLFVISILQFPRSLSGGHGRVEDEELPAAFCCLEGRQQIKSLHVSLKSAWDGTTVFCNNQCKKTPELCKHSGWCLPSLLLRTESQLWTLILHHRNKKSVSLSKPKHSTEKINSCLPKLTSVSRFVALLI